MATPPTEEVKRAASLLKPGRALDIACGSGRHAIWLHQNGWQVTAVDRDREAIEKIRSEYPQIELIILDLETDPLPEAHRDLIVTWLYHQPTLYPKIQQLLTPGGIAVLSVLKQGRFGAKPGELQTHFQNWPILHESETDRTYELTIQKL